MSEEYFNGIVVERARGISPVIHFYKEDIKEEYADKLSELDGCKCDSGCFWGTQQYTKSELLRIMGEKNE